MSRKKKVVFHSSFSRAKTGFGRNAREVLKYLYATGKYDVVEYGAGVRFSDENTKSTPWKSYGTLPQSDQELGSAAQDPSQLRMISYGSFNIDKVIELEKPDVYIGVEDIWGLSYCFDKPWWNVVNCAVWTTLDSVPILPTALENAPKIKNYWVWAGFAEREMKAKGFDVKTVHGVVPTRDFFPFNKESKTKLRSQFGLSNELIFGFVFRNQLRKLVGSLLEGFAEFKKKSKCNSKVLLHTHWGEGWPIEHIIKEHGLDPKDVLTTYFCAKCGSLDVKPFSGHGIDCRLCGAQKSCQNPSPNFGGTEEHMCQVYNLMDAYIHPITSGGLEMPIVEAMACALPVATVNYSCGEEFCKNKFVYDLSYTTYRELASYFIKASVSPASVATFMGRVKNNRELYARYGEQGCLWARDYFNPQRTFDFIEKFIDECPFVDPEKITTTKMAGDENYPLQDISDPTEWLIDMYDKILNMKEDKDSSGVKHWLSRLEAGLSRKQIYDFFVNTAKKENGKDKGTIEFKSLFKDNGRKRLAYVIPRSIGDCVISLSVLKALKNDYPDHDIYVGTEPSNFDVFYPFIGDLIAGIFPFDQRMDNCQILEGSSLHEGYVDIAFLPYVTTQKYANYVHNGLDKNLLQRTERDIVKDAEVDWTLQTR
jgi:glycosyltransferase involved in cell wall biosynthesis